MDECAVQKVVEVVEARDAVKGQVETAIAVVARFLEQKFVEKTGKKHLAIFQVRKTSKILRRQGNISDIICKNFLLFLSISFHDSCN